MKEEKKEMQNVPERIFLTFGESSDVEHIKDFNEFDTEFVYWSATKLEETDIEFVRATQSSNTAPSTGSGGFAKPVLPAVPYQVCPKCNGQGTVSKPSHIAGDVHQWSSSSVAFKCDVCEGAKIIPMFIVESNKLKNV